MTSPNHFIKTTLLSFSFCLLFHYVIGQSEQVQTRNPEICDSTGVYDNIPDNDPLLQLFDSTNFSDDFAMQWVGQYTGQTIPQKGRNTQIPDISILNINYCSTNTVDIIYESYYAPIISGEMSYDRYKVQSVDLTNKYAIQASRDDFKIAIVKDNSNRSILRVLLIKKCGDEDDWKKRVFILAAIQGWSNEGN